MDVDPVARVLVVDDDPVALTIAEACLVSAGMAVVVCDSAVAARTQLELALPDVIVSDVMMPGTTGLDLTTSLRADPRTRHIPVLLLTAAGDRAARVRALEFGADDLLAKPFDAAELSAKVRSLARLARMREATVGEGNLDAALGTVSEGVLAVDRTGVIVHANGAAGELLGLDHIAPGKPLTDVLPWLELSGDPSAPLLPSTTERALGVHGHETVLRITITDIGNTESAIRYIVTLRDMSDEHRASNLGDLVLSLITHKLRTPLTGIRGTTEMLLRSDGPPPPRPMIEVLHRSYLRLEQTIERILDVAAAALEGGSIALSEQTDLVTLVGQDPARPERTELLRRIDIDCPFEVRTSGLALATSLRELLNNALAACDPSQIQVSIVCRGEFLVLTVSDHGPGFPPGDAEKIFVPFFQSDRTGQDRGIGLGLTLVREVVRSAGGTVMATSPEQGGAVFVVRLPLTGPDDPVSLVHREGLRVS